MTGFSLQSWVRALALTAFVLGGTALVAPVAQAQDSAKPAPGGGKKKPGGKKGGKKGDKKDNDGVGPFNKKDYPIAERMRPLVLPDGMGEIGVGLPIGITSVAGESATGVGLGLGFGYGLGDVVELGLASGLLLSPDAGWNNTITPRVAWLAYDSKEFDFAPGVSIPLFFGDATAVGVLIDLNSRYVLSDGWFLYFGQGAVPLTVSPDFALGLNVGGGAGWQISKEAVLTLDSNLIQLTLVPDAAISGIWEVLNLRLGGQYSPSRNVDVGASLGVASLLGNDLTTFSITPYGTFRF